MQLEFQRRQLSNKKGSRIEPYFNPETPMDYIHHLINLKDPAQHDWMGIDTYEIQNASRSELIDLAKDPDFLYMVNWDDLFIENLWEVSDRKMTKAERKKAEHEIRYKTWVIDQVNESEEYSNGQNI